MTQSSRVSQVRRDARVRAERLETRVLMAFDTAAAPYVIPSQSGVETDPILTVGDAVPETDARRDGVDFVFENGVMKQVPQDGVYRMVGIPDGLGAFDNGNNGRRRHGGDDDDRRGDARGRDDDDDRRANRGGTFTVLMNHELGPTQGVVRDHGSTGAFVSRWVLRKSDLKVVSGDDQIKRVFLRDPATGEFGPATTFAFNRLCSADLAKQSAFYDPKSGLGTRELIYLNGEETRPPFDVRYGKAFAHVVTGREDGDSFELNEMGEMSFENVVASPFAQKKTVVMNLDDSTNAFTYNANGDLTDPTGAATQPSEVYVYVGEKRRRGNAVERAGLTDGNLFGVQVAGDPTELTVTGGERFNLVKMSEAAQNDGSALQSESVSKRITQFRRVEDGQWDPTKPRDFYFATTDRFAGETRLWRLRFDDVRRPELGGRIEIVYSATPGHVESPPPGTAPEPEPRPGEMFDNLTVDRRGRVLLQEDVGNNPHLGRIWALDPDSGRIAEVAIHNPALFSTPPVKTLDEESSGIIDVSDILGRDTYLFDVQAHLRLPDPELVEDGQFLAMKLDFRDLRDVNGERAFPSFFDGDDDDDDDDDDN